MHHNIGGFDVCLDCARQQFQRLNTNKLKQFGVHHINNQNNYSSKQIKNGLNIGLNNGLNNGSNNHNINAKLNINNKHNSNNEKMEMFL